MIGSRGKLVAGEQGRWQRKESGSRAGGSAIIAVDGPRSSCSPAPSESRKPLKSAPGIVLHRRLGSPQRDGHSAAFSVRRTSTEDPKDAVEDATVIDSWNAARRVRQNLFDDSRFKIAEFVAHNSRLPFGRLNNVQGLTMNPLWGELLQNARTNPQDSRDVRTRP